MGMMSSYLSFLMLDCGIELLFDQIRGIFELPVYRKVRVGSLVDVRCMWMYNNSGNWGRHDNVVVMHSSNRTMRISFSDYVVFMDDGRIITSKHARFGDIPSDWYCYVSDIESSVPPWGML